MMKDIFSFDETKLRQRLVKEYISIFFLSIKRFFLFVFECNKNWHLYCRSIELSYCHFHFVILFSDAIVRLAEALITMSLKLDQ